MKIILATTILAISTVAYADDIDYYEIVAQKLDESRNGLLPETGSSIYTFDKKPSLTCL